MVLGTAFGWSNGATLVASILLAFLFGYALTSLPLVRSGMPLRQVAPLAFASDTLSIATMEIVDTLIVVLIPGAIDAGLSDPLFWGSLARRARVAGAGRVPGQPPADRPRQGSRRAARAPLRSGARRIHPCRVSRSGGKRVTVAGMPRLSRRCAIGGGRGLRG